MKLKCELSPTTHHFLFLLRQRGCSYMLTAQLELTRWCHKSSKTSESISFDIWVKSHWNGKAILDWMEHSMTMTMACHAWIMEICWGGGHGVKCEFYAMRVDDILIQNTRKHSWWWICSQRFSLSLTLATRRKVASDDMLDARKWKLLNVVGTKSSRYLCCINL